MKKLLGWALMLSLVLVLGIAIEGNAEGEAYLDIPPGADSQVYAVRLTEENWGVPYKIHFSKSWSAYVYTWYYVQAEEETHYYFYLQTAANMYNVGFGVVNSADETLLERGFQGGQKAFLDFKAEPGQKLYIYFRVSNAPAENAFFSICTDAHHKPGMESKVINEATCTEEGTRAYLCELCLQPTQLTTIMPAKGHTNTSGEWVILRDATCGATGERMMKCDVCGQEIYREAIPTLPHGETQWVVKTEATCETEGVQAQVCQVCGKTLKEERIPARGHVPADDFVTVTEPTATQNGLRVKYCAVCGEALEQEVIPALGLDQIGDRDGTPVHTDNEAWTCSNGHAGNTGNFCPECGEKRPEKHACPSCGFEFPEGAAYKFCPNCGAAQ